VTAERNRETGGDEIQ